ncbi:hypothetical protein BCR33DRAFT_753380 [Rhizoclosmatium globosum]|uniref:TPR-like protein n=1 Tax=Rhizoclosmatium globosum TaxID=329046 RepID=A0A1Y2CL56_9FUNG|nr:hypothetical protein BCR33DRAFT_753380 [Rhizoclosmatium globosum]|eukprot:ORY47759.1 hypothetical protein BCR33DRAFT_753380 [Rhizoclosmatium globosum]
MTQQPSAADEWQRIHQLNSSDSKDEVNYAPFKAVMTTNSSFFKPTFTSDSLDLPSYVSACISEFLGPDASPSKQSDVVQIGSALLGSFMQTAWTGPALDYDLLDLLPESIKSHLILVNNSDTLSTVPTAPWWKFRTLFVQQRVLDNQSNTLNESILETAVHVEKSLESEYFTQQQDLRIVAELRARFYLELGFVHHYYERNAKALAEFTRAQKATQLVWKLTGALGKRTKFQTFDVTQLVVIAESKDLHASAGQQPAVAETTTAMPETLALNDDTLLETIDYTDLESKGGNLRIIDQCILLAMCLNIKNENPTDGLTTEQMKPFVSRVLENPNNWMVHTMGLLLRSRLEAAKSRTTERSVLQLQAIVDQMAVEQDSTPSERLNHIYSIFIPSKWELESELADRLVSIGVVKSALEIFERLELWDNVVSNSKAEQIVRKQLESTPDSPKLHCLLGDITRDSKHYYEAWSISNQRYARAMRSLGSYYFRRVISLKCQVLRFGTPINPLFENSWFVMGCAALRAEDWNTAQRAFLKTVLLTATMSVRAMTRVFEIRSSPNPESLVDLGCLQILVHAVVHDIQGADGLTAGAHVKQINTLLEGVVNKMSGSARLFTLCPSSTQVKSSKLALEYLGKAYRVYLHAPELNNDERLFKLGADVTERLAEGYREFGPLESAPRLDSEAVDGATDEAERPVLVPVCADWRYQARTALRTFISRTKDTYEGTPEHDHLKEILASFSAASE